MQYLAPINAFALDWQQVSKEDQHALTELVREKGVVVKEGFKPEKVWVSNNDSSYYLLIIKNVAAPTTLNFTLQSVTAKQRELGIIGII